jgi:hypothetical protein
MILVDGHLPPGKHKARLDANRLASGVYLLRFESGKHSLVRKMVLLK